MSAEELAAMDAKIVADTIAEMQRQIEQLTGARHSMYDPAVAIARDIANRTPPAMSADHIGEATNMVAPMEAVAWRVRGPRGGWIHSDKLPSSWRNAEPLYTHPAPIKPSADTGELKSAAPAEQGRGQFVEETVVSDAMSAFRGARTHGYPEQDAMRHALNSVLAALQAAPAVELKPNTGELRERVARVIGDRKGHPKPWSEDYDLADAILDLIQSERAG